MNFLSKIPSSLQFLLLVMAVLGGLGMIIWASGNPGQIVAGIFIVMSALAGMGMFFFDRSQKAKAEGFAKGVEANAASTEGVKDPLKLAAMDQLRKEFQKGIKIYQDMDKDLYGLPWYVVVGESSSGKTEMLRRSEIGFPQKKVIVDNLVPDTGGREEYFWQGSGGTQSMHWWFTNKAVILDTAGRLFVNEGESSASRAQWISFLRMLKKNRPDCPINGLLLVIPANRLLTHPDHHIEAAGLEVLDRNASRIASQMETLQSELGVRFPVYLVITKMDKLNGFREFFARIESPEERYQMLGWSNPAPLETPFDPQSVADYMASVADRLKRRMMSELRQVVPQNPNGLRINEVDALFAFPTVFASMTDKLTRYLRHIFATDETDEWSAEPPFLRGIYFTSSLQKGAVLDEALAAALGIPVADLDRGGEDEDDSLSRHRTYFVRDLFLDKVFREKGLVTAAASAKSAIGGWKLWLPVLALAAIVALGVTGWLDSKKDRKQEKEKWGEIFQSHGGAKKTRILRLAEFNGGKIEPAKSEDAEKFLDALSQLGEEVSGPPDFGWALRPAMIFDPLVKQRQRTYCDIVGETLASLENAIIESLNHRKDKSNEWSDKDWSALKALVILRQISNWNAKDDKVEYQDGNKIFSHELDEQISRLMDLAGIESHGANIPQAKLLAKALRHAAHLKPGTLLEESLTKHRKADKEKNLKAISRILPQTSQQTIEKKKAKFNEFAETLIKCTSYNSITAELARDAENLPDVGFRRGENDKPAVGREGFFQFLEEHPHWKEKCGYDELERAELSDKAKALAGNPALRKEVQDTLSLIKPGSEVQLNLENIGGFTQEPKFATPPSADDIDNGAKDAAKAAADIRQKLSGLRKEWFKEEFFRNHFPDYLRFPIVRGAKQGTNEDFLLLWRLCRFAKELNIQTKQITSLEKVYNFFFDTSAIDDRKIPLRKCEIVVKGGGLTSRRITAEEKVGATWDLFKTEQERNYKAFEFYLDETLTFTTTHKERQTKEERVGPWHMAGILAKKVEGSWRYRGENDDEKGVEFLITIPGFDPASELKIWPTVAEFQNKNP